MEIYDRTVNLHLLDKKIRENIYHVHVYAFVNQNCLDTESIWQWHTFDPGTVNVWKQSV